MKRDEEHPHPADHLRQPSPRRPHLTVSASSSTPCATGGTLVTATHYLAERGAKDVTAINITAAPEGIQYVQDHIDPSIAFKVVVCAVDEKLNEKAYIVPGLGDAGDRLYGVIDWMERIRPSSARPYEIRLRL